MKVMDIDGLCLVCGYFIRDTDTNNGYGCNHPGNDGYEILWRDGDNTRPKVRQGKCYPSSVSELWLFSDDIFPSVTWESEPKKVRITLEAIEV